MYPILFVPTFRLYIGKVPSGGQGDKEHSAAVGKEDAVLFHGDFKHLGSGGAVDVAAFFKYLLPPGLTGHPCDDAGFNSGKVRDDQLIAILWNKGCADELR